MKGFSAIVVALSCVPLTIAGTPVDVVVTGEVEFNQITDLPLGEANRSDPVTMTFRVDSNDFVDSAIFPTRGYPIVPGSFDLRIGSVSIGLQDPFPAGSTPYFVMRDNDPAVDGFLLGSNPDVGFPDGVPLDQTGRFEQFRMVYATTYPVDRLSSLDIAGAEGTYDFTGLSVFSMRISDGPVESAMGMIFERMTITVVPSPGAVGVGAPLLAIISAHRRRLRAPSEAQPALVGASRG